MNTNMSFRTTRLKKPKAKAALLFVVLTNNLAFLSDSSTLSYDFGEKSVSTHTLWEVKKSCFNLRV